MMKRKLIFSFILVFANIVFVQAKPIKSVMHPEKSIDCLYEKNTDGLCDVGFYSNCKNPLFCQHQRKKEAKKVCTSHKLDFPRHRAGLILGCYMGSETCYCTPTD